MQSTLAFSFLLALCLITLQCVESNSIARALSARRDSATSLSRRGQKPPKHENNEGKGGKGHADEGSDGLDLCGNLRSFADRQTKLTFFKAPFLDNLAELQVEQTFSDKCYSWLDKVAPDYSPSSPKMEYFDAGKQEAKALVCQRNTVRGSKRE